MQAREKRHSVWVRGQVKAQGRPRFVLHCASGQALLEGPGVVSSERCSSNVVASRASRLHCYTKFRYLEYLRCPKDGEFKTAVGFAKAPFARSGWKYWAQNRHGGRDVPPYAILRLLSHPFTDMYLGTSDLLQPKAGVYRPGRQLHLRDQGRAREERQDRHVSRSRSLLFGLQLLVAATAG